jgi:hypothetical protein
VKRTKISKNPEEIRRRKEKAMIRFLSSVITAFLLVAGTQGTMSWAQANPLSRQALIVPGGNVIAGNFTGAPAPWQGGRPYGDYQQTCRDIRYNGNLLTANCQKRDGGWRASSLDYRGCRGPVINDDGHLKCGEGGPGHGNVGAGGLPRGDYKETCQNIRMDGSKLVANCQKRDGGWSTSKVDNAYQCRNIVNNDGRLECSR